MRFLIQQRLQRCQAIDDQVWLVLDCCIERGKGQSADSLSISALGRVRRRAHQILIMYKGEEVQDDRCDELVIGRRRVNEGISYSRCDDRTIAGR